MARLLFEGLAVHCDDIVLLRQAQVVPYPRRLWIRPTTVALIPQIAPLAARLAPDEVLALDPSEVGFEWRIEPGPVDTIFFLEPDLELTATVLEPCPKYAMAARLMSQSSLPSGGAQQWVGDVCRLVDSAACYLLRWGTLDTSVATVKTALTG
jgi:hypothetical protein